MENNKNKGRTILIAGIVLVALALTASIAAACAPAGVGGASLNIIAFGVIGLLVVNVISLIVSSKKTK